ncbi:putative CDC12-septin [Catenaria anguillulae PL171]|uniref:Putative CDC12-septin n=1 Tax=Catenaria anguillulae PL171 TaxID=765915 RepID=A0A1Y2HGE4_9FUNG|nr:putative CDC12-septin [Catenaria anguillulae PL171]
MLNGAASSTIGIANLPNQTHKIVSRKGATFTLMVVGESGTGKTTYINTLLTTTIKAYRDPAKRREMLARKTVSIDVIRVEFEEKGFRTQLNVVDTPGFGDYVNNRDAWQPIIDFIDGQHESYLRQEMQPERSDILDGRVHACLYFIYPSGGTLRALDIETMKRLGSRVNLIPVVAKADTLTPKDLAQFKRRVRDAIAHYEINVYTPPVESDTEGVAERNVALIDAMPYAVIGSEDDVQTPDGRVVRGRQYLWGVSEVENDEHCDFRKLRNLLIRSHMLDLVTTTEERHYEHFRSTHLDANGRIVSTVTRKDAKFKEEEDNLRRRFAEQVKAKEAMFRQWEQKLIAERDKLNKDLEHEHSYITTLTQEIKALEERLAGKK